MYILIKKDEKKVLGYTVWSGFGDGGKINDSFNDVAIVSFESNEKSVSVRMFSTKEYAFNESKRIEKEIKEHLNIQIELDIMPLDVYINHIERWK
jgi:hypothetical protein